MKKQLILFLVVNMTSEKENFKKDGWIIGIQIINKLRKSRPKSTKH